jgi:transposase
MLQELLVTEELIARQPPEAQAIIRLLLARIRELEARLAELEARLNKTPRNASLPPSSEHPHAKPAPQTKKSGKKPGGQPGHAKHERSLIPVEQCQETVPLKPTACRRCGTTLSGSDPQPLRHQVWELPEIKPIVTEYQRHRLTCPCCGETTCGELPAGVPLSQAGPRLVAFVALLMGCFKQSKRRVALFLEQVLNQPCSPGGVVKLQNQATAALRPASDEAATQLPTEKVLGIDESPTKEGPAKGWVWTVVASTFTFFACRTSRTADVLKQLFGDGYDGVIHCDRARMYWSIGKLQWCWAHLKLDFQAWIDDPCPTKKRLGRDLMRPTLELFALWKKVRDGTLSCRQFLIDVQPIRTEIDALLLRG